MTIITSIINYIFIYYILYIGSSSKIKININKNNLRNSNLQFEDDYFRGQDDYSGGQDDYSCIQDDYFFFSLLSSSNKISCAIL